MKMTGLFLSVAGLLFTVAVRGDDTSLDTAPTVIAAVDVADSARTTSANEESSADVASPKTLPEPTRISRPPGVTTEALAIVKPSTSSDQSEAKPASTNVSATLSGSTKATPRSPANMDPPRAPNATPINPPERDRGPIESLMPSGFLPWLSVQYDTSAEVAEQNIGYSSFQAFVPFAQWDGGLFFFNGDGFLNNYGRWGSNVGGGARWHNPSNNRILGVNSYWDNNNTSFGTFNQLGFGVESLGRYLDLRANGYVAVGDTEKVLGVSYSNPRFFNHFILLQQTTTTAAAMSGFDSEIGGWVPGLGDYGLRAYAGMYGHEGPHAPSTLGGHFRLEERASDNLSLNVTLDTDRTFGTTVLFSAAYRFGGGSSRRGSSRGNVLSRMVDAVERNHNIVVLDPEVVADVPATKPGTDTPIYVNHMASYAAAGGTGSFEHPFNTLQNPTTPQQADILFVWANSSFSGQSMALLNNQRFLGEGLRYQFASAQGAFVLPRATTFINAPVIDGAVLDAVTLANNNEVANFAITNAGQNGISGDSVSGFYIHDNSITTSALNGIMLTNVDGTGTIANNVVSFNGNLTGPVAVVPVFGEGIYLQGGNFTGDITGNTASNNGDLTGGGFGNIVQIAGGQTVRFGEGIAVDVASYSGSISNNIASNNGTLTGINTPVDGITNAGTLSFGHGIAVNATTSFNGAIDGNTTIGNGSVGASSGGGNIVVFNTGTANFGQGIVVNAGTFNGSINGNTSTGNGSFDTLDTTFGVIGVGATPTVFGQGIAVTAGTFVGDISGNRTDDNGAFANIPPGSAAVSGSTTFGQGIALLNTATFNGNITGNSSSGNGAFGPSTFGLQAVHATDTTVFGQGILVLGGTQFNGNVSGNTANGNGAFGSMSADFAPVASDAGVALTFGQGIAFVNTTSINGSIAGNTANGNGSFAAVSANAAVDSEGTGTFSQGILVLNAATFTGNISGNTANSNGTFGDIANFSSAVVAGGATTTFSQGIAIVNPGTFTGNISSNTANGNGTFGNISSFSTGVSTTTGGTTTFSQGIAVVNATTFNGDVSGNTANANGAFGKVDAFSTGVTTNGTTTFSQGLFVQSVDYQGSIAANTLIGNGFFVPVGAFSTNVSISGGTAIYGQGMFLNGTGNGSFMALVDNNRFGFNFGRQNTDIDGLPGTDLLAIYSGTNKMGVELSGSTTLNVFTVPPPFNYDLQNQSSGIFNLQDNQAITGGNGSVGTSQGTAPTVGPVPF